MTGPSPRPGPGRHFVLRAGSAWPGQVRFVEGREPRDALVAGETLAAAEVARQGNLGRLATAPPVTVEVALSTGAARLLELRTGDEVVIGLLDGVGLPPVRLVVTGLFEPRDPAAELWELDPSALRPLPGESDREGTFRTASAFMGAEALTALSKVMVSSSPATVLTVRVDVDPSTLLPEDAATLATGVRRATTQVVGLPLSNATPYNPNLGFTSGLPDALEQYAQRRGPVVALAAVLLAGLLGCAAVVLFLASRLLLERRRTALALAVTRGASPGQGLGVLSLEAFLVAAPAAAAGAALAALAVPGRTGTLGYTLVALTALVPVVATPAAAWSQVAPRRGRTPVAAPGRRLGAVVRHGRGAGEVLLLGVTVVAVAALVSRGVTADPPADGADGAGALGAAGVDPLVTATPLLVGVSVAAAHAPGAGAPAAVRRPSRGPAARPRGVPRARPRRPRRGARGVGDGGADGGARRRVAGGGHAGHARRGRGGGVLERGGRRPPGDRRRPGRRTRPRRWRACPGVESATPVTAVREVPFSVIRPGVAGSLTPDARVTALAVDPAGLDDVQRGVPGRPALPPAFAGSSAEGSDGAEVLPVVVSAGLAAQGDDVRFEVGLRKLRGIVVAALRRVPRRARRTGPWMLVGVEPLREATGAELSAQVLLARAPGLADVATLPGGTLGAVRAAVGEGAVTTPANWRAESTSSALVRAVRGGVPVAVAAGGVLAALAVLLTLLAGGASRRRFLAHLRALGLSGRQAGWLVALEVLPGAAAALVAGLGAGVAMAWLVLPAADLRPLTGAVRDVGLVVDPWTVAAVALGLRRRPGASVWSPRRSTSGGSAPRRRHGWGTPSECGELAMNGRRMVQGRSGAPAVACEGLVRIFRTADVEVQALQGLDLHLAPGDLVAVVGASGSGKSTLLNILSGLDAPSAGRVEVAGHDLVAMRRRERVAYQRHVVGFVWQQTARNLLPYLTSAENVTLPLAVARAPRPVRRERVGRPAGPARRRALPRPAAGGDVRRRAAAGGARRRAGERAGGAAGGRADRRAGRGDVRRGVRAPPARERRARRHRARRDARRAGERARRPHGRDPRRPHGERGAAAHGGRRARRGAGDRGGVRGARPGRADAAAARLRQRARAARPGAAGPGAGPHRRLAGAAAPRPRTRPDRGEDGDD